MEAKPRTIRLTDDELAVIEEASRLQAGTPQDGRREPGGWSAWVRRVALKTARQVVAARRERS